MNPKASNRNGRLYISSTPRRNENYWSATLRDLLVQSRFDILFEEFWPIISVMQDESKKKELLDEMMKVAKAITPNLYENTLKPYTPWDAGDYDIPAKKQIWISSE